MTSVASHRAWIPIHVPACPLCGSTELKTKSQHREKSLEKCRGCGVVFVTPQPSPDALCDHFQGGGLVPASFDTHFEVNRQPVLSEVLHSIQTIKNEGTILDVGCATGFFLENFANNSNWVACGTELSLPAAQEARRRGLRVNVGDTRSAKFRDRSFDVITVLDAFYYFPEPASELAELGRILDDDGVLVMELPWANARLWQRAAILSKVLNRARGPLIESSDHLFYYTPKSVSLLLEACGFRVRAIQPVRANRQPGALRNLLWSSYSFVSRWLWRLSGGAIFLGPRFLVIADKRPQ